MNSLDKDKVRNLRKLALEQLLDGKSKLSISSYRSLLRCYPKDKTLAMELACALAAASRLDEAREILYRETVESLTPGDKARYLTAEAFARSREKSPSDIEGPLKQSITNDPSFALPHLSLGRYWLWSKGDIEKARHYLESAEQINPRSLGVLLNRIALEVEAKNYLEAYRRAVRTTRMFPGAIRAWLAIVLTGLIASPRQGGLAVLALSLLTFFHFAGPVLYLVWMIFAMVAVINFRRLSSRFVALPLIYLLEVSLMFVARSILLGSIFP